MHHENNRDSASENRRRRRGYARGIVEAGGAEIPVYGSGCWLALPDTNSARVAAIVVAAECWACEADELEARLREEIATGRAEQQRMDAEHFAETAAAIRRDARQPSFAALCDRRGEPEKAERARRYGVAMRDGWQR